MKTIIYALLSVGFFVATASAGTPLIVDTVVTDMDGHGKHKVLGRFHDLTEDGKQVLITIDDMSYMVTPKLRDNGTVDLLLQMTYPPTQSGKIVMLGPCHQKQSLGKSREIAFGPLFYSTKVTKAK